MQLIGRRDRRGPPRVGLFGHLGACNIGNDASMQSLVSYIRSQHGDAVIDAMCSGPERVTELYGMSAVALFWQHRFEGRVSGAAAVPLKVVGKVLDTFRTGAWVRRHDVVMVPGAGVLEGAQRAGNQIIFEDRPVNVRYGTASQLAQAGVRKEVDREGILRAIEIEAADLQPCGGTHVKSTGQIGLILVRRCSKIRQDWRVEFVCGGRAERQSGRDFDLLRRMSDRLSCPPEDLPAAIEKLIAERDEHLKGLRSVLQQLAEVRGSAAIQAATRSPGGLRIVAEVLRDVHAELVLPLATEVAKKEKTVALLIHEESGQIVFAQHPSSGKDLQTILKQVLAKTPGKGGGSRDFVRAKLSDARRSVEALEMAKKLLDL